MGGGRAGAVVVAGAVLGVTLSGGAGPKQVLPPSVASGTPDVQPPALVVANPTNIKGVVAYDTTGWPQASHNGPAGRALRHTHVLGPVVYSVQPPVGGDHNPVWANCGTYTAPIPNERGVHDLEHGAVWVTYRPGLPATQVSRLRAFVERQSRIGPSRSRYMDLTPYPGLHSPIVISSWGFQLKVTSPTDPRLQRFVDTFRSSPTYTPEYGGPCTGGVGTPAQS